ncbi:MAG TPA: HIT domain-containing protein [Nonomuraea sp.]|nr:HIT domain-containing protein [Nonomuraea sp.]
MAGRAEASMPYQDDLVVVIMDINPVAPGDALVIPRVHAVGLNDLDEETGVHMADRPSAGGCTAPLRPPL